MIKIFRHIRQKMIDQGSLNRYLLYAIGEIVLVMIGILMALQINNWNEERKLRREELSILNNLLQTLEVADKQSEAYLVGERRLMRYLMSVLDINPDPDTLDKYSMTDDIFFEILWDFETNIPVINTYTDLKNTGKIALISNRNIRERFTNLETSINGLKILVDDRLTVQQLRIDRIAVDNLNFVRLLIRDMPYVNLTNETPNDYPAILSDPVIRNLLAIKLELTETVVRYRETLQNDIKALYHLIKMELDNREA